MSLAAGLRQAGYGVAVCPGPNESERCPLAGDDGCEAAHGADVIVAGLGLSKPQSREVLEALRARCAGTPLVVEVSHRIDWPAADATQPAQAGDAQNSGAPAPSPRRISEVP